MMRRVMPGLLVAAVLVACALVVGWSVNAQARKKSTRIDLDGALIKGQTHRGAVHLIERKQNHLGSLVKKRVHYRNRILAPYGERAETPGLQIDVEAEPDPSEAVQ